MSGDDLDQPAKKDKKTESEGGQRKRGGKENAAAAAMAAATTGEVEDEVGFVLKSTDFVRQLRAGQKTFNGKFTC